MKSARSIKLGYGPTCYRIKTLNENPVNIEEEIKFLKIEVKMVKKILKELRSSEFIPNQTSPIIKIKKDESLPERENNRGQMREVIQELKTCFQNCNGDVRNLLKPIQIETNLNETSHLAIV